MSTLYLRTFLVTVLTFYVGLSVRHFYRDPELVAPHTYLSLVLILVVAACAAGVVYLKRHVIDVILTVAGTLSLLQFIKLVSFDTIKLGGIAAGWLVLLGLILFAHQITKHWSGEARSWDDINVIDDAGLDLVTSQQ